MSDLAGPALEFHRVAVTPAQIARYSLPTAPRTTTDRRGEHMAATVQAEALPPDVLVDQLRDALDAVTDADALKEAREVGEAERDQILAVLDGLDGTE